MADGGVCVLSIPAAPYRGPSAPYERACQIAHYFSRHKSKSKLLLLDANADIGSEGALFKKVWRERYAGIIEYRPGFNTTDVDVGANTVIPLGIGRQGQGRRAERSAATARGSHCRTNGTGQRRQALVRSRLADV
ncbi:hypothetical protein [Pseudoduganella violaceinigra]|uniref:hypothetical protein n=1 Tax=Pseudoduganella violaceinigra TaxID=246602 RepID=UPI0035316A8F